MAMIGRRILLLCGDYAEDAQVVAPFFALQSLGHTVHAVCPNRHAGESIRTAIHDDQGGQTHAEIGGRLFRLNASFDQIARDSYDALLLPGGRAPEYLRLDGRVLAMVRDFFFDERIVAAIGHGAQIPAAAGMLVGRRVSSYPSCRPDVEMAGGRFVPLVIDQALADGNLITAPAWPALARWLALLVDRLAAVEAPAARVASGVAG